MSAWWQGLLHDRWELVAMAIGLVAWCVYRVLKVRRQALEWERQTFRRKGKEN